MPSRELPESLILLLGRARELEASASGTYRERAAIAAMSALLLAAYEAGWQQAELARVLGMPRPTLHNRVHAARQAHPDGPGIVVDAPPDQLRSRSSVLRVPVDEREWLTISEATAYVRRSEATIRNWLSRGVLPSTDQSGRGVRLYSRADLDRVMAAIRRRPGGVHVDFEWLLDYLDSAPT